LTSRGKHRVIAGALGYFLPARQFLPGGLLINGVGILALSPKFSGFWAACGAQMARAEIAQMRGIKAREKRGRKEEYRHALR
jgi:Zn-dependent protease